MIYVDGSQAAPLRRYLHTMLEGSDPNQGRYGYSITSTLNMAVSVPPAKCNHVCVRCAQRLKFTVVSEPVDEDEDCVDVGHAFLNLKDLLLTGNDVVEQQIESRCWTWHDAIFANERMQSASLDLCE